MRQWTPAAVCSLTVVARQRMLMLEAYAPVSTGCDRGIGMPRNSAPKTRSTLTGFSLSTGADGKLPAGALTAGAFEVHAPSAVGQRRAGRRAGFR